MTVDRWLLVATLLATVVGTVIGILGYIADVRERRPAFRLERRDMNPHGGFMLVLHAAPPAHDHCVLRSVSVVQPPATRLEISGGAYAPGVSPRFADRVTPSIPPVTAVVPAHLIVTLDVSSEPRDKIVLSIEWADRTSLIRRSKVSA